MINHGIILEVVKCTGSSIGQLLFNNKEKSVVPHACNSANCTICTKNLRAQSKEVISTTTGRKYHIDSNLNCDNCGIYKVSSPFLSLYTGKTTTNFGNRFDEHFDTSKISSVLDHSKNCLMGKTKDQYNIQFLENVFSRVKYIHFQRVFMERKIERDHQYPKNFETLICLANL